MTILAKKNLTLFLTLLAIGLVPKFAKANCPGSEGQFSLGSAKKDGFDPQSWAQYELGAKCLAGMKPGAKKIEAESCYRSPQEQEKTCKGICGKSSCPGLCAKPGGSFHQGGWQGGPGAQSGGGSYRRVACDMKKLEGVKRNLAVQAFKPFLQTVGTRCYGNNYVVHIDNHPTGYSDKNGICPQ